MILSNIKQIALLCILAAAPVSATVCANFSGCALRNIVTGRQTPLSDTSVNSYTISSKGRNRFSIVCNVDYKSGESHFIKFFYDGKVHDEFNEPRWLDGDSNQGGYIVPVPYLSTCGSKKVKVQGNVWSNVCFEKEFLLEARCNSAPTAPVALPPVPQSITAKPVNAPTISPTRKPVVPPTPMPTKLSCANPFGNPCGPGTACKDTETGITCTPLFDSDICPVGCDSDAQCIKGKCECNEGFYRPNPSLGCVANPVLTLAPRAVTATPVVAPTLKPIEKVSCANPFGNPCGPGTACKDTETGITCTPLFDDDICPVGCDLNAQCIKGKCECNEGFYRPNPSFGCMVVQP